MKKGKKFMAVVLMAALCLVMTACGHAVPSAELTVDSATGTGTASFTMVIPKNGVPDVGNNFIEPNGDDGPNETAYIKDPEALLELARNNLPEDFTIVMEEQTKMVEQEDEFGDVVAVDEGSFDYTVTFSFDSIDDYNAKMKRWLPQQYWDAAQEVLGTEVIEAALATDTRSLSVDMRILDVICQWAFNLASTDTTGAVVDGGSGFDYQYFYNMDQASVTVVLDGQEVSGRYGSDSNLLTAGDAGAEPPATEAVETQPATAGLSPTEPSTAEPATTEPSPTAPSEEAQNGGLSTGAIAAIVAGILVVVVVAVVCAVAVIRKRGKK